LNVYQFYNQSNECGSTPNCELWYVTTADPMIDLLRAIAANEPAPWYPTEFARSAGVSRDSLDEPLNRLRVAGLVRMTDWEAGKGQGYFLTPGGQRALRRPEGVPAATAPPSSRRSAPRIKAATDDATITRLLIAAQVGMFAVGLVQALEAGTPVNVYLFTGYAPIRDQLAVSPRAIADGAWWTLLSYALVHGGLMHLGCNLLGHFYDVALLERLLGRVRFLSVYLISVLFGGIGAVLATLATPNLKTIGSSGGLCGVFAAQLIWLTFQRHLFHQGEWNSLIRNYLRVVILIAIISAIPGVSWGGHLGGAIGGLLTCALIQLTTRERPTLKWLGWILIVLLPCAGIGGLWWWLHLQ
jgi:membrane associated rhomboid family serine protease